MGGNVCNLSEPASGRTTRWRPHHICALPAISPACLATHDACIGSARHILLGRLAGLGSFAARKPDESPASAGVPATRSKEKASRLLCFADVCNNHHAHALFPNRSEARGSTCE